MKDDDRQLPKINPHKNKSDEMTVKFRSLIYQAEKKIKDDFGYELLPWERDLVLLEMVSSHHRYYMQEEMKKRLRRDGLNPKDYKG